MPAVGAGADAELEELRRRCGGAVATVASAGPDVVYVVGLDGPVRATSLAPWGGDVAVDVPEPLPLAVLAGAWLTAGTRRSFVVVDDDLSSEDCAALGADLAASAPAVGLLVMGDGSARHSEKAPGYLDPRAAAYDEEVTRALAAADRDALLALDPSLARDLMVAGRAPWQVLAGAASGAAAPQARAMFEAPYGVGYHVATWTWPPPPVR